MPLLKTIRTLECGVETTIGTAASSLDGTFHAYDVMVQAEIENITRESSNTFGYLQSSQGGYKATVSFKTDLQLTATTAPSWLAILLQGCGYVASGSVFTPRSEGLSASSGVKSVTLKSYQDGVIKSAVGCAGNFKITAPAGKLVTIEWEFQGVWVPPVDGAVPTPTYSVERPVRYADSAAIWNSNEHCVESVEFDAGNEIIMRECPDTVQGFKSGLIVNRTPMIKINPEAQLVADDDRYGDWLLGTEAAFTTSFKSVLVDLSAVEMTLAAPKAQIVNIQEGDRNKLITDEIDLQCNRNGAAVDEDVSISFGAQA